MDIWTILLRTVLMYFLIYLSMRLMGKREIGKLSVFDLVISIMIAEIAVLVIEDTKKPLLEGILPIACLAIIQIFIAYITLKNQKIRQWLDGKPSVIVKDGKINDEEMKKQRYSLDDLLLQLRENQVRSVADVELAMLEPTGKLSIIEKEQSYDGGKIRFEGLPLPLVMDGKVQDENLQQIGKTRFWLKNIVQQRGAEDFKDVFFCTIDHRGNIYFDKKDK